MPGYTNSNCRSRKIAVALFAVALPWRVSVMAEQEWKNLRDDGLHDPDNPALSVMQNPAEAFARLPRDTAGNKVDWIRALRNRFIQPRSKLRGAGDVSPPLDLDIIFKETGDMPFVRFPHYEHTEWLACSNCHEKLFKSQAGANQIEMLAILQGEFCGRCHGAVSFPLTECRRCHSVPQNEEQDDASLE